MVLVKVIFLFLYRGSDRVVVVVFLIVPFLSLKGENLSDFEDSVHQDFGFEYLHLLDHSMVFEDFSVTGSFYTFLTKHCHF